MKPDATASPYSTGDAGPLHELNAVALRYLITMARDPQASGGPCLVQRLRERLALLTAADCERIARAPICLVDAGFGQEEHWKAITRSPAPPDVPSEEAFAPEVARALSRTILNLAWTSARTEPVIARIRFGMTRQTAQIVAGLGIHQIQQIAETHFHSLRPLWAEQLGFWQYLVAAAAAPSPKLPPVHIRLMQRRLADLLPATAASPRTPSSRP